MYLKLQAQSVRSVASMALQETGLQLQTLHCCSCLPLAEFRWLCQNTHVCDDSFSSAPSMHTSGWLFSTTVTCTVLTICLTQIDIGVDSGKTRQQKNKKK